MFVFGTALQEMDKRVMTEVKDWVIPESSQRKEERRKKERTKNKEERTKNKEQRRKKKEERRQCVLKNV